MPRPFELSEGALRARLDEMVEVTFADLQSQFLLLPRGPSFIDYPRFEAAYEVLKKATNGFVEFDAARVWAAVEANALVFVIVRTILGVSPPEWAELARESGTEIDQGGARALDKNARTKPQFFAARAKFGSATSDSISRTRARAMIETAVAAIVKGAPIEVEEDVIHRLAKIDTQAGSKSLRFVSAEAVPYAVLLYERFLGRPFASHRDAVSELVGDVMENAVEDVLRKNRISFRKTKRAEQVPGFEQAPDFFVPDEQAASIIIEAKITSDDGTARDKVSRILRLRSLSMTMRQSVSEFSVDPPC